MKNVIVVFALTLVSNFFNHLVAQQLSYNEFKVVTEAWQIGHWIKNTPTNDPVYLVLAPGVYKISQPITIDRIGAVYIHGLSMAGTLLTDSIGYASEDLFIVKRTNKFSLVGLTIRTQKAPKTAFESWKGCVVRFEQNVANVPHDVEIQEIEQGSSFKINAPGTYRVHASRVPNLGYIVNHPNADFVMTQGHSWVYQGNFPKPKSESGNFLNNYSLSHPDDISFMKDSTCIVWQKKGRVRIYGTNNVMSGCAYEYRFENKSDLGPHVIVGLRNEIEANNYPTLEICAADKRIFKALAKVTGYGNEIIVKSSSIVKSGAFFDGICAEKIAIVDFQSIDGKAFILGNANKEGANKLIMNSAGTNLENAKIVLLGNKVASLPAYNGMVNSTEIPQILYADVQLGQSNRIVNMGNMTRLNSGVHPVTGQYLTGAEDPYSYGDELFSDLYLANVDSLMNAPIIPSEVPPHALNLPQFSLKYNPNAPDDPATNHELLWRNILINIRNYGAKPNDGQDDFLAIQQAIDTAALSNGLLYFPTGQFDISKTIEFNTITGYPSPLKSNDFRYGAPNNTLVNLGRSILIAGSGANETVVNGLGDVLSIFSITNSRLSRMQGLTMKVNDGKIKTIRGLTSASKPSEAIVAVDNFDSCDTLGTGVHYGSIYLWNFNDCNFIGGQVGASTQMRKQMFGQVRNHKTGRKDMGLFSGQLKSNCTVDFYGGLGESFVLNNCTFENNNLGFVTAHHQAFCHFISDCQFLNDSIGVIQYGARGSDPFRGDTGYTADNAGGNFTIVHTEFNNLARDFQTSFQTQTVPDYLSHCKFSAPTALFVNGDNYPTIANSWLPTYRRNKNTIVMVDHCDFTYDHTQDALYKNQPFVNNPKIFEDYFKYFTFVANNRSSIFCLNSDLSKTTFIKGGTAPQPAISNSTAGLQGVGFGMIVQCKMPGFPDSKFSTYGTKPVTSFYFNFKPDNPSIPASIPIFPIGYGTDPPVGLYIPRYFPKEIISLELGTTSIANDYYFWRIGMMASGGTLQRHRDYALPMQRILLYNAGEQILSHVDNINMVQKTLNISVYPNPFQNVINIEMESKKDDFGVLTLTDLFGRQLFSKSINVLEGKQIYTFDLLNLPNNYYFLTFLSKEIAVTKKVFKIGY